MARRQWVRNTNQSPGLIALVRRARRGLPGDPDFGDPLSTAGEGGPRAAARAAGRLLGERGGASREVSLGALQVWQALTEAVSRRPANAEVTMVFTDLVEFSNWSLRAGDDATLKLLRRVARAIEPPLLDAGGHIVKRMGDGTMAVFADPLVAVERGPGGQASAEVGRRRRLQAADAGGNPHRPPAAAGGRLARRRRQRRRPGDGAGHPRRGHGVRRHPGPARRRRLGHTGGPAKRVHWPVFAGKPAGLPADLAIYRLKTSRETVSDLSGLDNPDDDGPQA